MGTRETTARPASEVRQARISIELARELEADAELLGLAGRSDIVRGALDMLHRRAVEPSSRRAVEPSSRRAVELRMAQDISRYYDGQPAPPPLSVVSHRRPDKQ